MLSATSSSCENPETSRQSAADPEKRQNTTCASRASAYQDLNVEFAKQDAISALEKKHMDHIAVYGPDNHLRLTGLHETQSIDRFNYGIADRGASVRVPHSFVRDGYRGYLEDRRPNSLGDPYRIAGRILQTIETVPTYAEEAVAA